MKGKMKGKKQIALLMALCLSIGMLTTTSANVKDNNAGVITKNVQTLSANKKTKTKKVNKKKKGKTGFVTKDGKKYYLKSGKKLKSIILETKKYKYLLDKNGVVVTGWKQYKGKYYYFDRTSGKMAIKKKIDGISLDKYGRAKKNKLNAAKINTMIKARKTVNKVCKVSDTKDQKLRKCFDYIAKVPYRRYRFLKPIYHKKGWESTFADDVFDKGSGCCVSMSAALAFMLHECGYSTVYVVHDSEHAWVELNGRVYDALFARAKDYNKYYNLSYGNFSCHPVDKRKI